MRYAVSTFQHQGQGVCLLYVGVQNKDPVEVFNYVHGAYLAYGAEEVTEDQFFSQLSFFDREKVKQLSLFYGQVYF